ncbi:hypothetical protein BWI17_17345 [Betaproteobacteria bacterium GR16-43]|nr:hypothetical protein BWI17_17345 [Betaproteobacteria bacterium GR16-43]
MTRRFLIVAAALSACVVHAQLDPLTLPSPRPVSKGQYQYGIEMLRLDRAWELTRGRAPIAITDGGLVFPHEDLRSGLEGNVRLHISVTGPAQNAYHATMVAGVAVARGFNGKGVTGACPSCSASVHSVSRIIEAVAAGAVATNVSFGGSSSNNSDPDTCANGRQSPGVCADVKLAEERDLLIASSAGNIKTNRMFMYSVEPTVVAVGGVEPDGTFWDDNYEDPSNLGSSWGPQLKLVTPARDVLVVHPTGGVLYPGLRCGDRIDSTVGLTPTMGPAYTGYGDCSGTSFSSPWISGIVGLIRSANPLLTNSEVRAILYETATVPVAGPEGLTFHLPDAQAAVQRALGAGKTNRVTPMFALYAASASRHLFTSIPQGAVAAIAGEFGVNGVVTRPSFTSVGDPIPGYPTFNGCFGTPCVKPAARKVFSVFTTEARPDGRSLVPLYRMTQVCAAGSAGCATTRAFAYASSEADVHALEQRGYVLDMVEGYIYAPSEMPPAGARAICMAFDAARIDHILYAADSCNRTALPDGNGGTTGGNYAHVALLGYDAVDLPPPSNYTALWWNAAESGWGLNLTHQGDVIFGTLFTYDANRNPLWLVMSEGRFSGGAYSGTLYRTTGPAFNANPFTPIGPGNLLRVGDMRLTFGAGSATLNYDVDGVQVSKNLTRQVFSGAAATCAATGGSRASATNYQDLWWNPAESGWGLNLTQQGNILFATLFTYGLDGRGIWYFMSAGQRQGDGSFTGDLYRTVGSPFNAAPFTPLSPADVTRVGAMTLRFTNGETGTLQYTVDGIAVTKSIVRQVFASPQPVCNG